jgi:adenylate cyclase
MNQFLAELRRRNVFRVAAAYLVVGWLLMQFAALIETGLGLPAWFDAMIIAMLAIGFPVAILLAWAFEMTPEGMKKTSEADEAVSFRQLGGTDYVLIGLMVVVLGLIGWQQLTRPQGSASTDRHDETGPRTPSVQNSSIAVLPFADLSTDSDKQYFGDGIAEEILNVLARIDVLEVTSRTSAFAFRSNSELSIPDIAETLGVRHVLEGSIRTAGGNIRITAQLIDAASDTHLWSETYDRALTAENVFAIQDEIANAITAQLTQRLGINVTSEPGAVTGGTSEVDAYEAYLEGRNLFINRNYINLQLAIAALERAVEADPEFGRAWGVLAMAYVVSPQWGFTDRDYYPLALNAADRAFAFAPDNADAYTAMGVYYQQQTPSDYNASVRSYEQAIASDPQATTAYLWLGQAWRNLGYFDRTQAAIDACLAIDPDYPVCLFTRAEVSLFQGHYEAAKTTLLEVYSTAHTEAYPTMLGGVAQQGDDVLLTLMLREMADLISPDARWMVTDLRRALSNEDYDRAAALRRFQIRLSAFEGQGAYSDPYTISSYLLAFRAYDQLAEFAATDSTWWWAPGYPGMAESAARHTAIEAGNLPSYWREHGFPPQCRPIGADDYECD